MEHQHTLIQDLYQKKNVSLAIAQSAIEDIYEKDFGQALLLKSIQVKVRPWGLGKTIQLLSTAVEKFFFPYDQRQDDKYIESIPTHDDSEPREPVPPVMDPYYPNSVSRVTDPTRFEMLYHPDKVKEDAQNKGGQKVASKLATAILRKARQAQIDSAASPKGISDLNSQEVALKPEGPPMSKEEKESIEDAERARARYIRR